MALKSFYQQLYRYGETVDIETIETLAKCVLRNLTREELTATAKEGVFENILDVGCGVGHNLMVLLANTRTNLVIGSDISSAAVRIAKRRMAKRAGRFKQKSDFVICDAESLPFKELCFDLTVCTEVLEHLPNDELGIGELSRVTKTNGKVFLSVPSAKDSFGKFVTKISPTTIRKPVEVIGKGYFGLQTGGDLRNYRIEDLTKKLTRSRLKIIRHWFNGRFFYFLSVQLNSLILNLGQELMKIGGTPRTEIQGDILRESANIVRNIQKIKRLIGLYSRIVIPLSNAILSLDRILLRFDYGGNLTVEAQPVHI